MIDIRVRCCSAQ